MIMNSSRGCTHSGNSLSLSVSLSIYICVIFLSTNKYEPMLFSLQDYRKRHDHSFRPACRDRVSHDAAGYIAD